MYLSIFADWINANTAFINLMTSLILSLATTIYVIFTIKLVKETRKARIQQLEPHLTMYLDNAETQAHLLFIKVKNLGQGVAYNVRFKIVKDLDYTDSISLIKRTLFRDGIKYFPGKHEFKYTLTSLMSNKKKKKEDYVELIIYYNDALGNNHEENFRLNLTDAYGDGVMSPPDTHLGMISYRLEKIEKILKDK